MLQGVIIFWIWGQTIHSWLTAKVLHHRIVCIDLVAFFCVHTSDLVQLPGNQLFQGTSQFVFATSCYQLLAHKLPHAQVLLTQMTDL